MSRKEKIDFYLSKIMSRKLMAFIIASIGLFTCHITSTDWIIMATVYISIEGTLNVVKELKKSDNNI